MGRLTAADVACWLLKTSTPPQYLIPGWVPGQERLLSRCVRRSYRLTLMGPGQPCVLWLSGPRGAGVHAVGRVAGAPEDPERPDAQPSVAVTLVLLHRPVPRRELLQRRDFADAEVVRMAAGSNPSYLTHRQLAALEILDGAADPAGAVPAG